MNVAFTELMKRPDIDQAVTSYTEMTTKIRDRLTTDTGRAWEQRSEGGGTSCGNEFPGVDEDGGKRTLPRWMLAGNLTDQQWPQAETSVGEIAAGYGFNPRPEVVVDRPGEHDVVFRKPDGAWVGFGTAVNTTLTAATGCHLTAKAHQHGAPAENRG